jgi:hypothetical protein
VWAGEDPGPGCFDATGVDDADSAAVDLLIAVVVNRDCRGSVHHMRECTYVEVLEHTSTVVSGEAVIA